MVDLTFAIEGAEVDRYAAAPALLFKLCVINETPDVGVENVLLHCQIRIEAARRTYALEDRERLVELFGETHRWKETLQSMLWTHTNVQVSAFEGQRVVELPVPCSFDFNVVATKYFFGLEGGEVLAGVNLVQWHSLLIGTQMVPGAWNLISWSKEEPTGPGADLAGVMDFYYPQTAWLRIDGGSSDEIYHCRKRRYDGFSGWDETLRALLTRQREESCHEPCAVEAIAKAVLYEGYIPLSVPGLGS